MAWLTGDVARGKDLAQNILVKIYDKPHLYNPSRSFKTWLFSIARNNFKNEIRNEITRARHLKAGGSFLHSSLPEEEEPLVKKEILAQAMQQLGENHREVIILKYSNNLSIQEIGEILGCSEGTVKSRLFYAIRKLRNFITITI